MVYIDISSKFERSSAIRVFMVILLLFASVSLITNTAYLSTNTDLVVMRYLYGLLICGKRRPHAGCIVSNMITLFTIHLFVQGFEIIHNVSSSVCLIVPHFCTSSLNPANSASLSQATRESSQVNQVIKSIKIHHWSVLS